MLRSTVRISLLSLAFAGLVACSGSTDSAAPGAGSAAAPKVATAGGSGPSAVITTGTGVAATVGGEPITYEQLDEGAAAQLVRLKTQAYDIRKQALDQLIDERLMEAEANKRGISKEDLLKAEVEDKLTEPTDEEAKAFFEKNPPRGNVDFDKFKARVKAYMTRQSEQEVRGAFIAKLRKDANVEVFLEPMRFDVSFDDDDPIFGKKDAPVVIVEFSDFECPYCSRVVDTIGQIKKNYADKVAIVFRDFPLPMHPNAPKASEAGHCANDQGKFWEMHDMLFANQRALQPEDLKGYAQKLELDEAAFAACLDSGKYADEIEADKKDGQAVGVSGTPAFFINGKFLNGARPYEDFVEIIDEELAQKKAQGLL